MPRQADHDQRRAQIADAAIQQAAESGLESVTIARVADQARFSVGLVQHYYPSKRALLEESYRRTLGQALERVAAEVEAGEQAGRSIRSMMIAGLEQLLPLDASRRAECAVRVQFDARAVHDAELARVAAQAIAVVLDQIAQALANGRECGETARGIDERERAWALWCLCQGLASAGLIESGVPVRAVLGDAVTAALPHPCAHGRASAAERTGRS